MARRPKRRRTTLAAAKVVASPANVNQNDNSKENNDSSQGGVLDEEEDPNLLERGRSTSNQAVVTDRLAQLQNECKLPERAWCKENLAFCCAACHCDGDVDDDEYPYIFSESEGTTWPHRKCCHQAFEVANQGEWATHYEAAACKLADSTVDPSLLKNFRPDPSPLEWVTPRKIQEAYETAKTQESALYNADGEADALCVLHTHPDYAPAIEVPFRKLVAEADQKPPRKAVVLDVFAGVGTGIVVLKRLCIGIEKVIHVEHDKVASHVYKDNHDFNYNRTLQNDGIEHAYEYETWEKLVGTNMEEFLEKHGPIDIIVGGPPCVEFSLVNARREGTSGRQGQYMVQLGQFVRRVERHQQPHPVFFMAENVWLRGEDLSEVREAFGFDWDPILFDALYVSPTRRKRHFFTNVPLPNIDYAGTIGPSKCLEDGFCVPAHLVDPEVTAKAQCLMASKTRINERATLRMYVFNKNPNSKTGNYHGRPMKIFEREALMGYKEGYVEAPVRKLFKVLVENGLSQYCRTYKDYETWREKLDKKYHCFAGNYHRLPVPNVHRFEQVKEVNSDTDEYIPRFQPELKMAPPVASNQSAPTFFNAEDYAKHLIGNAYSVPVVEHLLRPLQGIFELQEYPGFDYNYAWDDETQEYLI